IPYIRGRSSRRSVPPPVPSGARGECLVLTGTFGRLPGQCARAHFKASRQARPPLDLEQRGHRRCSGDAGVAGWLVLGIVVCALGAISAGRVVNAALWVAASSILLAILLATIGVPVVAVVELSVGAGLVAVLFVFTIGIAGEEGLHARPVVPRPVA